MPVTYTGHGGTKSRRKANSVSLCLCGAWAVLVVALYAQLGATPQSTPQATFRAATKLIVTTVVVRNPDGTPVEGLTAADFIVTEDNEPQDIAFIQYQRLDDQAALPALTFVQGGAGAAPAPDLLSLVQPGITTPPAGDERFAVYKVSKRRDLDISSFTAAVWMRVDGDLIREARIASTPSCSVARCAVALICCARCDPTSSSNSSAACS